MAMEAPTELPVTSLAGPSSSSSSSNDLQAEKYRLQILEKEIGLLVARREVVTDRERNLLLSLTTDKLYSIADKNLTTTEVAENLIWDKVAETNEEVKHYWGNSCLWMKESPECTAAKKDILNGITRLRMGSKPWIEEPNCPAVHKPSINDPNYDFAKHDIRLNMEALTGHCRIKKRDHLQILASRKVQCGHKMHICPWVG